MTELLPCPFCGGEAELKPTYDLDADEIDGWFAWCCTANDCTTHPMTNDYLTRAEAIEAWNTRTERTCEDVDMYSAQFVCSECGAIVHLEDDCGYYTIRTDEYDGDFDSRDKLRMLRYCPNCGAKVVTS